MKGICIFIIIVVFIYLIGLFSHDSNDSGSTQRVTTREVTTDYARYKVLGERRQLERTLRRVHPKVTVEDMDRIYRASQYGSAHTNRVVDDILDDIRTR